MSIFEEIINGINQFWQSLKEWFGVPPKVNHNQPINQQRVMPQIPANAQPDKEPKKFVIIAKERKSFTVLSESQRSGNKKVGKIVVGPESRPLQCPMCKSKGTILKKGGGWYCKRNEEKDIGCGYEWGQ